MIENDHRVPYIMNNKRAYLPIKVSSQCPRCKEMVTKDFHDQYLSYPTLNQSFIIHFSHECEVDGEWDFPEWEYEKEVILRVALEEA
jgi:hypothetical protein